MEIIMKCCFLKIFQQCYKQKKILRLKLTIFKYYELKWECWSCREPWWSSKVKHFIDDKMKLWNISKMSLTSWICLLG